MSQRPKSLIREVLKDQSSLVKYSAATALIGFKDEAAIPILKEILLAQIPCNKERVVPPALDAQQITDLKLSVLGTLQKNDWKILNDIILEVANNDQNNSVATKAKELLNILKK